MSRNPGRIVAPCLPFGHLPGSYEHEHPTRAMEHAATWIKSNFVQYFFMARSKASLMMKLLTPSLVIDVFRSQAGWISESICFKRGKKRNPSWSWWCGIRQRIVVQLVSHEVTTSTTTNKKKKKKFQVAICSSGICSQLTRFEKKLRNCYPSMNN